MGDASAKSTRSQESGSQSPKGRSAAPVSATARGGADYAAGGTARQVARPGSQPPVINRGRPTASPRPHQYRNSATYTTPRAEGARPGTRPQVRTQTRTGHSAGPSRRHWQNDTGTP